MILRENSLSSMQVGDVRSEIDSRIDDMNRMRKHVEERRNNIEKKKKLGQYEQIKVDIFN